MINNRGKNFLYKSYVFSTQKIFCDMFSQLNSVESTCSISRDFIDEFLIFEKAAERISKNFASCTNFRPVFNIASEIARNRSEIICDVQKIKNYCGNFKNCPVAVRNYRTGLKKICENYCTELKSITVPCNLNIFFLKFMNEYNNFSALLIENALKYRICPQLRLISEYTVLTIRKENIKMKDILNPIK